MSSIDDMSIASGITNLSRISKTSSSLLYKIDSTNLSEYRSSYRDSRYLSSESLKIDGKRLPDAALVNKALSVCEESTCECAKYELIYKCLAEIVNSNNVALCDKTLDKLKEALSIHQIKKYIHLPSISKDQDELTILGIFQNESFPKHDFSYEEQLAIRSCLEGNIREKLHSFIAKYEAFAGSAKDIIKSNESKLRSRFLQKGELELLHWQDKIEEVYLEYNKDLSNCQKMLEEWCQLKSKFTYENEKDAKNCMLEAEIAEMKTVIAKLTCSIRMYKETPITVDALKIINDNLDVKIEQVCQEISEKQELKKAYEDLCTTPEYNEILRQYLELESVIKKKKSFLEKLSSYD